MMNFSQTIKNDYSSPRWSGEILDCSMPLTFDQYSICSYRCLYCFAFFQKSVGVAAKNYLSGNVRSVNVDRVRKIFTGEISSQFWPYIQSRKTIQWGGMADPFDETERHYSVGLELIKFFAEMGQQVSFSTKGTWWTEDERYIQYFRGNQNFNVKVSIITLDTYKAKKVEVLVDSPQERLACIGRLAKLGIGGVTLRLRPFIIGLTDLTLEELIKQAADNGVEAVSTEFLCAESRARLAKIRYKTISEVIGVDLLESYKKHSATTGYMRLNRNVKRPYIERVQAACERYGLRLYVSDAHFKELCPNGSCCGLRQEFRYSRGQFTEALLIAKKNGVVRFSDIESNLDYLQGIIWKKADGLNTSSSEKRCKFHDFTLFDFVRYNWNDVNGSSSPYKYFGGALIPDGVDENGDVIYRYNL